MKKILFTVLIVFPLACAAQSLSIAQLYERLEQDLGYKQDVLQIQIARESYSELRVGRLPVFYVDANLQRNLIIPTTPVPAIAFDPTAPDGAIIPLKFATRWSSKAGIQLEWNLFDPKRRAEEKEQLLNLEKSEIQQLQNAQSWRRDATLAYASIVLATQQYALTLKDSSAYAEILEISRLRYEEGREPAANYIAAQQESERKRMLMHEAWNVLIDADLELRHYIDLTGTESLTTDIDGIIAYIQPQEKVNYELKMLEIDQQITRMHQRSIRRQLLPSLSVNAYLGEQYFSNELNFTLKDQWYGNSFVNLAVRLPLSAYLTAQPTLRKAAYSYELTAIQIEQEQRADQIKKQQSTEKIKHARQKIGSFRHIERLAFQAKDGQHAAYLEGRILLTEYHQSVSAHIKALQDIWQAEYDLIQLLMERTFPE